MEYWEKEMEKRRRRERKEEKEEEEELTELKKEQELGEFCIWVQLEAFHMH